MSSSKPSQPHGTVAAANASNAISPAMSIVPYTHGLEGVNVGQDRLITHLLWLSIVAVFLVVLLTRFAQMSHAHLRLLFNLHANTTQQTYWSKDRSTWWASLKKQLLYAPLYKKRHNREIQLSKAINMGTLPSRLHMILLILYLSSNIAYCSLLDYSVPNHAAVLADLRGRSGHLGIINMVPLIVLAGRNNPLIPMLRISFDTYNLFHRWIGRIVVLEAVIHTLAWGANTYAVGGGQEINSRIAKSTFLQYGVLGTIGMLLIILQSPGPLRHAFYETFLHIHQLLAFATVLGVYVHVDVHNLPQLPFLKCIVALWVIERSLRWLRIVYRNVSRSGCTKVTVEALPGEACRVTFELKRPWNHSSGTHVYAYLPSVSLWMSHPFSVAWYEERPAPYLTPEDEKLPTTKSELDLPLSTRTTTSISLIMSKRTGMTEKLYNKARASPTGVITMSGAVEGPYGGLESLHSYGTVLLFAGGVGITHQVSHVRNLLQGNLDGTVATRKIILVWTVRVTEQLEWVRPWMDEILAMPNRREVLKILMFVTRPKNAREVVSASTTVQMYPGRATPSVIIDREMTERVGAMVVTVCGPGALADDIREAVRGRTDKGTLDFVEESFTW